MRSTTLVTTLTSLTTAMAIAAPIVVFGFVYVLKVQPERVAALEAQHQLAGAQAELNKRRVFARRSSIVTQVSALDTFDARIADGGTVADVVDTLTALLNSPAVGGVSNLSIETGPSADGAGDSAIKLLARRVEHTPVVMTFDARHDQIGRFFWNLRSMPTVFDLRSVELIPGAESLRGVMRAKVLLHVYQRPDGVVPSQPKTQVVDVVTPPQWDRDPFASKPRAPEVVAAMPPPAPVVSSILFSSARQVAHVDGRIVRTGDRVGSEVVESIERDAVVFADASGARRRVELERPIIRMARR